MLESEYNPRIDANNDSYHQPAALGKVHRSGESSPYKNNQMQKQNQQMQTVLTHSALRHRSLLSETCSDINSVAFGATNKNNTGNLTSDKKNQPVVRIQEY